jgi:hypothetical protein
MGTPVTPSDIEARAFLTTPGRQAAGFAEHAVPVLTPVTFVLSFFTLGLDPGKIRQETYEIFGRLSVITDCRGWQWSSSTMSMNEWKPRCLGVAVVPRDKIR